MIYTIVKYEIWHWMRRYPMYIYGGILFLLGFSAMLIGGDILGEQIANPYGQEYFNAPVSIYLNVFCQLNLLIFFVLPAIYGSTLSRDFSTGMNRILYSYPIRSIKYLFSKYLAASLISIIIMGCLGLGAAIGEQVPGLSPEFIGPFRPLGYLQIYLYYVIPTVLFLGGIIMTAVAITRNIYAGYIVVLVLIIFRILIRSALRHPDYLFLVSALDPYTSMTAMYATMDWDWTNINEELLPLNPVVLWNRAFYGVLFIVSAIGAWRFFRLEDAPQFSLLKTFTTQKKKYSQENTYETVSDISYDFSFIQKLKNVWALSIINLRSVVFAKSFLAVLVILGILLVIIIGQVNPEFISSNRPFTQIILFFPMIIYGLILSLVTFIYAGVLTNRATNVQMDQLIDTTPVSNWMLVLSNLLSLIKIQMILLVLVLIVGIVIQTISGFYLYDFKQYIFHLFFISLVGRVLAATLSIFVHTLIPNQYLAIFTLILIMFGVSGLESMGVHAQVLRLNEFPRMQYSDLDGYGTQLTPFIAYSVYWLLGGLILFTLTLLLWKRGVVSDYRDRISIFKNRLGAKFTIALGFLIVSFISSACFIHWETRMETLGYSPKELELHKISAEQNLSDYMNRPQPKLERVYVQMDLYPEERRYEASGRHLYINNTGEEIKSIWINKISEQCTSMKVSRSYKTISSDSLLHFTIITLDKALAPLDTILFEYTVESVPNNLLKTNSLIKKNGTFIMPELPHIGFPDFRVQDSLTRIKHGLHALTQINRYPENKVNLRKSYVQEDLLHYESIVSTTGNQRAFTSGHLVKDWSKNNRNYFHYKSKEKIRNGFIYLSGKYSVKSELYKGVNFEIYHHETHDHNLDYMMNAMKATLDFCGSNYAPYQFDAMRIIEFPISYGSFAQSFAGLIAYSEMAGFMKNVNDSSSAFWNSPFRLTSHEMSHQWWGHQVVPADALGSKFITEGSADYVAAKVTGQYFDERRRQNIIDVSRREYFRSRNNVGKEAPLIHVPADQTFVAYQKGSLALRALDEYLGDHKLDDALGRYFKKVRFQGPLYTSSIEFIDSIKSATPDSLHYLVDDYLSKVILYHNYIEDVQVQKVNKTEYSIDMKLVISKYANDIISMKTYTDGNGDRKKEYITSNEKTIKSLPLQDYVYIGIYGSTGIAEEDRPLHYKSYRFDEIHNELSITLDSQPTRVVIDPKKLLLDAQMEDNTLIIKGNL